MGESRYRFTWVGGQDPGLETVIPTTYVNPSTLTLVVNSNLTVTLTASTGTPFVNVSAGGTVYIYSTYDTPAGGTATYWFNPSNAGWWNVLSASSTVLVLSKPAGQSFQAVGETVNVIATSGAGQIIIYSASGGVQVGDMVDVEASAFLPDTRRAYTVLTVTSNFFEVVSTLPIANTD